MNMKTTAIIMTIAMGLAPQAMAAGPDNSPSATTHKNTFQQRVYPFLEPKTAPSYKIERYGGISSRPWAQSVGWASQTTQFAGDRERFYAPHFNLFWFGATPK
jgi:hypothetical protein